ncbi:hypothetical protein M2146_001092 [Lachnospiraceae bacterium PF1-22]
MMSKKYGKEIGIRAGVDSDYYVISMIPGVLESKGYKVMDSWEKAVEYTGGDSKGYRYVTLLKENCEIQIIASSDSDYLRSLCAEEDSFSDTVTEALHVGLYLRGVETARLREIHVANGDPEDQTYTN